MLGSIGLNWLRRRQRYSLNETEQYDARAVLLAQRQQRRHSAWRWFALVGGGFLLLWFVGNQVAGSGWADVSEGTRTSGQIERVSKGSCLFGEKHSQCLHLVLSVERENAEGYRTELDVNVPDRDRYKIQVGRKIALIVARDEPTKVRLDREAFELLVLPKVAD